MTSRRIGLEHRAVPRTYEPGYPAQLSAREYERLILPSTRLRVAELAVATGLLASASAGAQDGAESGREERVLELLRGLHSAPGGFTGSWYPRTTFKLGADPSEHAVVPSIPISFGNSMNGVFDTGRARELALELFRAYGLEPRSDEPMTLGAGAAVLDGYDAARRVGFELRGLSPKRNEMFAQPAEEAPERELDDSERELLEEQGIRVQVADLRNYPLMDGDQFTPTLAYLAGIVSFLNEVAEGPDVDLSAILLQRAQAFPLPEPAELELPDGVTASSTHGHLELVVERNAVVGIPFGARGSARPLSGRGRYEMGEPLDATLPTRGAPTTLQLAHYRDPLGAEVAPGEFGISMRLVQAGSEDLPGTDVTVQGTTLFAPSSFDAKRPFRIELGLAPGAHQFYLPRLMVGARTAR